MLRRGRFKVKPMPRSDITSAGIMPINRAQAGNATTVSTTPTAARRPHNHVSGEWGNLSSLTLVGGVVTLAHMSPMRIAGLVMIGLGIGLLIVGFATSIDLLGFLFMISVLVGVALVGADFVMRRRKRTVT